MNFVERRDIFIAYHGTYDDYGSLNKAKQLFYFLESRGVKCYFFPTEKSAYFAETPVAVPGASNPCFYIKKKEDGQLYDFFYEQYQYIRERGTEK